MRDKHYKPRSIRIDDELWLELQKLAAEKKSWNLLLKELLEDFKFYNNK